MPLVAFTVSQALPFLQQFQFLALMVPRVLPQLSYLKKMDG
jgi:hypothetical protein